MPVKALAAILQQTRQHHAIEHATIHLLAARFPRVVLAGISDPWGFTLYGQVTGESIEEAVGEALRRLQSGEEEIAFHPNCGTNLTTGIFLATAAALIGSSDWRRPRLRRRGDSQSERRRSLLDKALRTTALVTLALLAAAPLGMRLQRFTTSAAVGDRELAKIAPVGRAHRITFNVV